MRFVFVDEIIKFASKNKSVRPNLIIAHTIKGKNVKFMENKFESHYQVLDKKEYDLALKGLKV